jgi:N6-adenosine-specific RNA methylase IME4
MDATRKLGEMMDAQRQTVGLNKGGGDHRVIEKPGALPTLASQGIDKNLAHQARTLASLNEATYEQRRTEARAAAGRIVRRVVNEVRIEQERQRYRERTYEGGTVDDLSALAASGYRAGIIYCDPPWMFEVYSGKGKSRSAERRYDCMTLDQIKALPVGALAADDCALLLWGVWPKLFDATPEVIEAWGFEYKTLGFLWVKQTASGGLWIEESLATGLGYYTRANSEYCLLATRGQPLRLNANVHQVIMAPVGDHSEKVRGSRAPHRTLVSRTLPRAFCPPRASGLAMLGQ